MSPHSTSEVSAVSKCGASSSVHQGLLPKILPPLTGEDNVKGYKREQP